MVTQNHENHNSDNCRINDLIRFFPGNTVLHSPMAVEKLGVWEDPSPDDGPGPGHHIRGGEATEEEAFA